MRPAGLLRRLAAMIYDGLLVLALWLLTLLPLVALQNDAVHGPAVRAILFLELYGFFAWFWVSRGQTLGMLAWRLELHSEHGGRFTLTQATLRFLGALAALACLGLGYLWVLFHPARRGWPDLLSASYLVEVPRTRP